jgi:para-nitrobenzyl esterase
MKITNHMKKTIFTLMAILLCSTASARNNPQVGTREGIVEGLYESGISIFKGIPFAAPPVGQLRWKAPQPAAHWAGVRQAREFGPNPMQEPVFGDMNFGTRKVSEDCLYLNIWTPAKTFQEKLPVIIYFNGGGLIAGSGSEPRYDGMSMARKGIVAITANYREGIFGFFAHPQLSRETTYKGSGDYGFLDQVAAIRWVKDNIAAFGGDPDHITIAGESAGSMSVSYPHGLSFSQRIIPAGHRFEWISNGISPTSDPEASRKGGNGIREKDGVQEYQGFKGLVC